MVDAINFREISPKLATCGVVNSASLFELYHVGYKMIIDLRSEGEKDVDLVPFAKDAKIEYVSIPVKGMDGLGIDQVKKFVELFDNVEDGAVLLSCASANRAGAMWAAYNIVKGESFEDSMSRGRLSGMGTGWNEILLEIQKSL